MNRKMNNKGVSLVELIVAITIMLVLVGVVAPQMFNYVGKAKQVRVETEVSELTRAAQVALIEVTMEGNAPKSDCIKNKTKQSSPYYKGGTKYGNLTNWTVHNGVVAGASNGPFADRFFNLLGIAYGEGWESKSSTIPISMQAPKTNPSGSMTNECMFQVFYDSDANVIVEYSRDGYFVRMENSVLVDSIKIRNSTDKLFTQWQ